MNALLSYLIQVTCISGLLYGYYHFALRNKQFHQYNRFYLLGSAALAIILPFLQIPVYFSKAETEGSFVLQTLTVISSGNPSEPVIAGNTLAEAEPVLSTTDILRIAYAFIGVIILTRVLLSLLKIRRMIKRNTVEPVENIRFVNTAEPGTPFSFFSWLFWNRDISLRSEKGKQIFRHELFHIHQKHSLDVMFMELLTVICWINPFFHLMKKEVRAIHEFLADRYAMQHAEKWEYAEMLLMQAFQTKQHLVNPFFHNQIKRRIAMITTSAKPSYRYARKLMVLPLAAAAAAIFAFSYRKSQEVHVTSPAKPITVVIDAGHGGDDKGAISADGVNEKDIVLAIAKKIMELNDDPQVSIILTREQDDFPSLKSRTDLVAEKKTDLFISLHMNNTQGPTKKSGIEIFLPKDTKPHAAESRILGSLLLNYMHGVYATPPTIKQIGTSVWVLEKPDCPSALIELGHLQNTSDLQYIRNSDNQEKIAKLILQAIDQYMTQSSGTDWEERKKQVSGLVSPDEPGSGKTKDFVLLHEEVTFHAMNMTVEEVPEKLNAYVKNAIYFINGKKTNRADLKGKHIEAKSLFIYAPNSATAIKKFGPVAKPGVMEFEGAFIEPQPAIVDTTPTDKVFVRVEVEPSFPGGMEKWGQYLKVNLNNEVTKGKSIKDGAYTVIVQFIVGTDGSISDVRSLTKHGHGMEEEAIRVIRKGPKWVPGIQNGKQVAAYRKQPITFIVGKGEKGFRPDGEGTADIHLYNSTEFANPFLGKTDPATLYIGMDNKLKIAGDVDPADVEATISSGTVEKKGEFLIIKVPMEGEVALVLMHHGNMNKKVIFAAKLLPNPTVSADPVKQDFPKIRLGDLKNADVATLLQLPKSTDVESFTFSIDTDNGEIHSMHNAGNLFNESIKNMIASAKPGKLITVDLIRVRENGKSLKAPSKVYEVVN